MKFNTYTSHVAAAALKAGHRVSVRLGANPEGVQYITVGKLYPLALTDEGVPSFIDNEGDKCTLNMGLRSYLEPEAVFHDLTDEEALAVFPRDHIGEDADGNAIHSGDRVEFIEHDDNKSDIWGEQGVVLPFLGRCSPEVMIQGLILGYTPDQLVVVECNDSDVGSTFTPLIRRVQLC